MRNNLFILTFILLLSGISNAQTDSGEVYTFCHTLPIFPGGDTACANFLTRNIVIPDDVKKNNLDGTSIIQFVLERNGTLSTFEIKKSISKSMDDEIVRVFKSMPVWSPAKVSNITVRYQIAMPIVVKQLDYMIFDSLVQYVDSSFQIVNKEVSTHYKVVKNKKKYFSITCYLKNGTLLETYECSKLIPEVKHGRFVQYYDSLKVKMEGKYYKGKKQGLFHTFAKNGQKLAKENFKDDLRDGLCVYYSEINDSNYVEKVFDNGIVLSTDNSSNSNVFEDEVFTIVEKAPEFPGGDAARMNFLSQNIIYPKEAIKKGIQGTVYIEFIVEKDGSITKPHIKRDPGGGLGDEALRVINLMPKWEPGTQRGIPVRTAFVLPIKFL